MIFASHIFIFLFLPLTLLGYFALNKFRSPLPARLFLVAANLFFYAVFNPSYLLIIGSSILVNYACGALLWQDWPPRRRQLILGIGILFNIGMLGYFKYADFFIANVNTLFQLDWTMRNILLPLGISFFTFQQLAYLLDIYSGSLKERYSLLTFSLFVSFFPQLVAGPIVMPQEMMPQFEETANRRFNADNMAKGVWIFAIGLAKKILLADCFATYVDAAFQTGGAIDLATAWGGALGYTLQIYFDFSGYCDMAIGLGYMFNIKLPLNFNSPYQSVSIKEFWRRWHITLGRFLSIFVYFPLGGSRGSTTRTAINLLLTFLISGLWHGAGWLFVLWGLAHGVAMVIQNIWSAKLRFRMAPLLGMAITFLFLLFSWVLFRAENTEAAKQVYSGMFDFSPGSLRSSFADVSRNTLLLFAIGLAAVFALRNTASRIDGFKPTPCTGILTCALIAAAVFCMVRVSPFIYFNF